MSSLIHHATVKSAAAKGVELTSSEDDQTVTATRDGRSITMDASEAIDDETVNVSMGSDIAKDAWVALDEMLAYEADHPSIALTYEDGDFIAWPAGPNGQPDGDEIARDPELADLFETLADQPQDEAEGDADEEKADEGGSVVPAKYKALYAERGNPNHCGDWLADVLASLIRVLNEKGREVTDIDRLEALAVANGVEASKYGKLGIETNGWQGRYRMTVRNLMTPLVAAKGFLFVPEGCGRDEDTELTAPAGWIAEHSSKARVKEAAKAPAPSEGAAVQAKPGTGKKGSRKAAKDQGEAGLAEAKRALQAAKAKGNR